MRRFEAFEEAALGLDIFAGEESPFDPAPDCEDLPDTEDIIKKALTGERLPSEVVKRDGGDLAKSALGTTALERKMVSLRDWVDSMAVKGVSAQELADYAREKDPELAEMIEQIGDEE